MEIKIPLLSLDDAKILVSNANIALQDGTIKTNSKKRPLKQCPKCKVKFASKNFNYCPRCSVDRAHGIDLHNTDTDWKYRGRTFWARLTGSFAIVALCMTAWFVL